MANAHEEALPRARIGGDGELALLDAMLPSRCTDGRRFSCDAGRAQRPRHLVKPWLLLRQPPQTCAPFLHLPPGDASWQPLKLKLKHRLSPDLVLV